MSDEFRLGETTLRVYLLLVREGRAMSIREVQKALGFSSPGQAYHHLERLRLLGLVIRDSDGYRAVKRDGVLEGVLIVRTAILPRAAFYLGVLEGVLIVRTAILPRAAFYLGFSSTLTVAYVIGVLLRLTRLDLFAVVALSSLLVFSIIEFNDQWVKLRRLLRP